MTEITQLPADPNQLDGLSPYTLLPLIVRGEVTNWPEVSGSLANYLQALHRNFAGLFIRRAYGENSLAFVGPFINPDEYSVANPPISAMLISYGEGSVQDASRIIITEERKAEIANGYTLPPHLRQPANQIEAAISYIVAKLAGIDYDFTKSFGQLAIESQSAIIAQPEFNIPQRQAAALYGEVALDDAQFNTLNRAEQLEALEHVLRFLLYSNYIREDRFSSKPPVLTMWTDYHHAGGLLAEALQVVQGHGYFEEAHRDDTEGLRMGLLPPKHRITITEDATLLSDGITDRPIWPAEKVREYQEELELKARAAREAAERAIQIGEDSRFVAKLQAQQKAGEKMLEVQAQMEQFANAGFIWKGVMPKQGRFATAQGIEEYLAQTYPGQEVRIIDEAAIYGGTTMALDKNSFTIYVRASAACAL